MLIQLQQRCLVSKTLSFFAQRDFADNLSQSEFDAEMREWCGDVLDRYQLEDGHAWFTVTRDSTKFALAATGSAGVTLPAKQAVGKAGGMK